jgi:microcystin-dependent protein
MPVALLPPATPEGETVITETRGAVTVRSAFAEVPLDEAVIVADAFAETATVVIVNVALVAPSATVTLAGSDAAALLDARLTTTPPAGAA